MALKTKILAAMMATLLVVGAVLINKAAGSFQKFQAAQTAQLAGF